MKGRLIGEVNERQPNTFLALVGSPLQAQVMAATWATRAQRLAISP